MFPWEHFAVGYVLYSLSVRVFSLQPPDWAALLAVLFGSQFPDLVDKPASWLFNVFPSGVSVAHSVFVATTLTVVAIAVAKYHGRADVGFAFGTGYLLHLPADAAFRTIVHGLPPDPRVFLWPIAPKYPDPPGEFVVNIKHYISQYPELFTTAEGLRFLGFEVTLLSGAFVLWLLDGAPGIPRSAKRYYVG